MIGSSKDAYILNETIQIPIYIWNILKSIIQIKRSKSVGSTVDGTEDIGSVDGLVLNKIGRKREKQLIKI